MAKITIYIPEPPPTYTTDGVRQINQALETLQNQLNTSFQQDMKEEIEREIWFSMKAGCC